MFERKECPECGSWNTERVDVQWLLDSVEEVRICNACPTEYTIAYGEPYITINEVSE